jgi:hypothetical protein
LGGFRRRHLGVFFSLNEKQIHIKKTRPLHH